LASEALRLRDVDAFYGDSHALHGVSFTLTEGRLLGLLGRNGAGKSTCMNVAVGLLPARTGAVELFGAPVTRLAPEDIAARGVALVPQGRRIFRSLTVRENLAVAARRGAAPKERNSALRRHGSAWTLDTVFDTFPRLGERRRQMAAHLSGGEQQMLAIGRALMANPRVLLLDEPSEGLAPQIVGEVMATIRRLKESGLSIVLVEQNPKLVFAIADDIVILNSGQVAAASTAAALRDRQAELRQHLGVF
jgi:branched-chain amino acid transport system ATP-binding protein